MSMLLITLLLCIALFTGTAAIQLQKTTTKPSITNPGYQGNNNRRRDFLISCLQAGSLAIQPVGSYALASEEAPSFNGNYVYRENWTGTSLSVISMEQAASTGKSDFQMGRWPDPILRRSASKVDEKLIGGNILKAVANRLRRTARVNKAVGLAAQQCGIDGSLIFLDDLKVNTMYKNSATSNIFRKDYQMDSGGTFLCNPRIIARSPEVEMKVWTEECLVLPPSFTATVLRDSSVVVQYENLEGQTKVKTLNGEIARALQHEMDHDRGILILDHVDLDDLESLEMKELEKAGHENRMTLAYSRYIETPTEGSLQLATKRFFIEPAYGLEEPNQNDRQTKTMEGGAENSDKCDEECKAQRKKIIEERRALMKQSKTTSDRRDVLELSRQRALLYDTKYKGL